MQQPLEYPAASSYHIQAIQERGDRRSKPSFILPHFQCNGSSSTHKNKKRGQIFRSQQLNCYKKKKAQNMDSQSKNYFKENTQQIMMKASFCQRKRGRPHTVFVSVLKACTAGLYRELVEVSLKCKTPGKCKERERSH